MIGILNFLNGNMAPQKILKRNIQDIQCSVKVKEVVTTANKEHEWIIHKFVLEDDFDDVFSLTRDEALEYFCWGLADDEMIGFELNVGNNINVPLSIEEGDKGYSDKKMIFNFEEK